MAVNNDSKTLAELNILVVEDTYEFRVFVSEFLTQHGAKVYVAENGKAGIKLFKRHRIDLVMTDIVMPEMDGIAMASVIRRFDCDTPIIFFSIYTDEFYIFTDGFGKTLKFRKAKPALNRLLRLLANDNGALFATLQTKSSSLLSSQYRSGSDSKKNMRQLPLPEHDASGLSSEITQRRSFNCWTESLSVLFVAYECHARDYISQLLEQYVDILYTANHAKDALRLFEYYRPRLVIASVTMKGMSGLELAEEIRSRCPDVQIILISDVESWSYQESKLLTLLKLAGNKFLAEPLDSDRLLNAIQLCLDQYDLICDMHISASMFMTTYLAMSISDVQGNIIAVNPAFSAITGYSQDDVKGVNLQTFCSTKHDSAFYNRIWESINQKGRWSGEIYGLRKQGSSFWEWVTIAAVRDWKGRISNYVSVFSVTNERSVAEEKLDSITQFDNISQTTLFSDKVEN